MKKQNGTHSKYWNARGANLEAARKEYGEIKVEKKKIYHFKFKTPFLLLGDVVSEDRVITDSKAKAIKILKRSYGPHVRFNLFRVSDITLFDTVAPITVNDEFEDLNSYSPLLDEDMLLDELLDR